MWWKGGSSSDGLRSPTGKTCHVSIECNGDDDESNRGDLSWFNGHPPDFHVLKGERFGGEGRECGQITLNDGLINHDMCTWFGKKRVVQQTTNSFIARWIAYWPMDLVTIFFFPKSVRLLRPAIRG